MPQNSTFVGSQAADACPSLAPIMRQGNTDEPSRGDAGFPLFPLLPAELRERVWQCFCAIVASEPRVLDFQIRPYRDGERWCWKAIPGPYLAARVRPAIAALTVTRECRSLALKAFPDTLAIRGNKIRGTVCFDKTRDVVAVSVVAVHGGWKDNFLGEPDEPFDVQSFHQIIPGFSDNIERLALKDVELCDDGTIYRMERVESWGGSIWEFLATFRNLKIVYELVDWGNYTLRELYWCGAMDAVNAFKITYTETRRGGKRRQIPVTTVWPDLEHHREFASRHANPPMRSLPEMAADYDLRGEEEEGFVERFGEAELWTMIQFYGHSSHRTLERLRQATRPEDLPDSDGSSMVDASCEARIDEDDPERCLDDLTDPDVVEGLAALHIAAGGPEPGSCSAGMPGGDEDAKSGSYDSDDDIYQLDDRRQPLWTDSCDFWPGYPQGHERADTAPSGTFAYNEAVDTWLADVLPEDGDPPSPIIRSSIYTPFMYRSA